MTASPARLVTSPVMSTPEYEPRTPISRRLRMFIEPRSISGSPAMESSASAALPTVSSGTAAPPSSANCSTTRAASHCDRCSAQT